jgi:hypothetical protein
VCRDSNQSFHPVPERGLQRDFWKSCELHQEVHFPKDRNVFSDNASYIRIERSMTVLNQESMLDGMRFSAILFIKFKRLPGCIRTDIVCMNDEMISNIFRRQFTNLLQNMFDIVCRIK